MKERKKKKKHRSLVRTLNLFFNQFEMNSKSLLRLFSWYNNEQTYTRSYLLTRGKAKIDPELKSIPHAHIKLFKMKTFFFSAVKKLLFKNGPTRPLFRVFSFFFKQILQQINVKKPCTYMVQGFEPMTF